mmetsp:Transcript_38338/g.105613  ORF Transcript_38338/g.105613 Transcript_38338/m.105613 type:complete len:226 (+) Transcript_38338:137-814(+)
MEIRVLMMAFRHLTKCHGQSTSETVRCCRRPHSPMLASIMIYVALKMIWICWIKQSATSGRLHGIPMQLSFSRRSILRRTKRSPTNTMMKAAQVKTKAIAAQRSTSTVVGVGDVMSADTKAILWRRLACDVTATWSTVRSSGTLTTAMLRRVMMKTVVASQATPNDSGMICQPMCSMRQQSQTSWVATQNMCDHCGQVPESSTTKLGILIAKAEHAVPGNLEEMD